MGRPRKAEGTDPVRIPKSVVMRLRRIATHLRMDPGDYIAERLAGQLDRDEAKMLSDIAKERKEAPEK